MQVTVVGTHAWADGAAHSNGRYSGTQPIGVAGADRLDSR